MSAFAISLTGAEQENVAHALYLSHHYNDT